MLRAMTDARRALVRKLENVDAFPLIALQAVHELRADLDSVEDIADALEITRQGVAYKLKVLAGNGHDESEEADDVVIDVREPDSETHGTPSS
jgi:predicted transcriptional regulator